MFWWLFSKKIPFSAISSYILFLLPLVCCRCCCYVASVVSDSVKSYRWQPTRLPCPWGSQGKNTGVGCHFLLQCMKVKTESEVAQSSSTLRDPMDCSLSGSSVYGIFQARVPEWIAIAFSSGARAQKSLGSSLEWGEEQSKTIWATFFPSIFHFRGNKAQLISQ